MLAVQAEGAQVRTVGCVPVLFVAAPSRFQLACTPLAPCSLPHDPTSCTQVTIGPWTERGFFYDFDMPQPLTEKDLPKIRKEMQRILRKNLPFIREEVSVEEARARIQVSAQQRLWACPACAGCGSACVWKALVMCSCVPRLRMFNSVVHSGELVAVSGRAIQAGDPGVDCGAGRTGSHHHLPHWCEQQWPASEDALYLV